MFRPVSKVACVTNYDNVFGPQQFCKWRSGWHRMFDSVLTNSMKAWMSTAGSCSSPCGRAHTSCCNGCFNVSEHGKVRKRASCEDMIDMQAIHTIHSYTMHYYAILVSRNFFKWYIERTESCSRCCKSFVSDPCPFQGTWGLAQVVCPFLLRHGPFPFFGTSHRYSRCCTCCQVWESGLLKFNIIRSVVCVQAS